MSFLRKWMRRSGGLKLEIFALFLACRDSRTPWYAKAVAAVVVGYAFSPIDLIPDPIPVIGYLDDLLILPLGVFVVRRMIPPQVLAECRQNARGMVHREKIVSRTAAIVILLFWLSAAAGLIWLAFKFM